MLGGQVRGWSVTDRVYRHRAWSAVRRQVLERDGHVCQIGGPKCLGAATEVDHIVPFSAGGSKYDVGNLRAACKPCNVGRSQVSRHERWRQAATQITLVYGPAGTDRAGYVAEHAAPGDLVVDYDQLGQALGSPDHAHHQQVHSTIVAARNAVLAQIRQGKTGAERVWIVSANAEAREVFPWHEAVGLGVGADPVVERREDVGGVFRSIDRAYRSGDAEPSRSW